MLLLLIFCYWWSRFCLVVVMLLLLLSNLSYCGCCWLLSIWNQVHLLLVLVLSDCCPSVFQVIVMLLLIDIFVSACSAVVEFDNFFFLSDCRFHMKHQSVWFMHACMHVEMLLMPNCDSCDNQQLLLSLLNNFFSSSSFSSSFKLSVWQQLQMPHLFLWSISANLHLFCFQWAYEVKVLF